MKNILVIGGGGYVGSALVPSLLKSGYSVTVYDLFLYGRLALDLHPNLTLVRGDVRNIELLKPLLHNCDAIIHLACISNDPSFELNPNLGKSINFDAFEPLVKEARSAGVRRFIFASSSSVYGIKSEKNVVEDMELDPLTDYSKYKMLCEKILLKYLNESFEVVNVRPATVCGFAKRQRLDVIVNIFVNQAFHNRSISIFGGNQLRPNIHIQDMVSVYLELLKADSKLVSGETFNAGYENLSVSEIANIVRSVVGNDVNLITTPSNDNRSYHVSSKKLTETLNFKPEYSVLSAAKDLNDAFDNNYFADTMNNPAYFNIKLMQNIKMV